MLGAPGGSRIINGVLQVLLNVVDFHMNVQDAVDWPRFPSPMDAGCAVYGARAFLPTR